LKISGNIFLFLILLAFGKGVKAQCSLSYFFTHEYDCLNGKSVVAYTISGAISPYSFTLTNVATSTNVTGSTLTNTGNISSVPIGQYNIFIKSANNCTALTVYQVNVPASVANPVVTTTSSCFGANNAKAFVSPPTSFTPSFGYYWSPGGQTTQSVANMTPNITYTLLVTDGKGCMVTNTVVFSEDSLIRSKLSNTLVPCFGAAMNVTATATGGLGPPFQFTVNNIPVSSSHTLSLSAGIHTVVSSDTKSCSATSTVLITQAPQHVFSNTITPPTCPGKSDAAIFVSISGSATGDTYTWSPGSSSTLSHIAVPAGSYTLSMKDPSNCVTSSVIVVNPASAIVAPIPQIQNENCSAADGSFTLNVSGGTPPYTYSTIPANAPGNLVTGLSTGSYTTIITDSKGCIDSVAFWLGNSSNVSLAAVATNSIKCYMSCTGNILLNVQNAVLPVTYSATGTPTTNSNILANLCPGTYIIRAVDAIGCPAFDTVVFSAPPAFTYSATTPGKVCLGKAVTLSGTAMGGSGNHTFIWNPGSLPGQSVTLVPAGTTTYSLNVYDSNGCTLAPYQVTVQVNPPISIDIDPSQSGICPGSTAQITPTVSGGDGNYSFLWEPGNSKASSVYVENITVPFYTLTVADACGSPTVSKQIEIKLFPVTIPRYAVESDTGCAPMCTRFYNLVPNSKSMIWNYGDKPFEQSGDTSSYCYTKPGNFDLRLTLVDQNSCKSSFTYTRAIYVKAGPSPDFVSDPEILTLNDAYDARILNKSAKASAFKWYVDNKLMANTRDLPFTFQDTGCYDVRLVVSNSEGCRDSTERTICVFEGFSLYMPNAFTPNMDGINDVLKPKGSGWVFENYLFEIYNRWGRKVFFTHTANEGWDGNLKQDSPYDVNSKADMNDTYIWRVLVRDNLQKDHEFKGVVVLVR